MNAWTFVSPYVFPVIHVPLIAKHPLVKLNPTFEVEVAKPEIARPLSVVVPKPERAISRAEIDDVAVPTAVVVAM
jgi:hypothetical protein